MKISSRINGLLSHLLGNVDGPLYVFLNWLANRVIFARHPETVTHPGRSYPDKTFYVISDVPGHAGLASWYDRVLGYMLRAERKGWVVVVDPPDPAQADSGSWYDFFNGPNGYRMEDVAHAANVVRAVEHAVIFKRYRKSNVARRHRLVAQIPLSDAARTFVDARLPGLFGDIRSPSVGVMFRGTDYRGCTGHARVPDVEVFCDTVRRRLEKWGLAGSGEEMFVVTEEQEALEAIRRRFPQCHFVAKERFSRHEVGPSLAFRRLPHTTPRENNLLYLLDIIALSRCDYLVGGLNGCVLMALNLNGNRYRDVHILKTGVY